MRMALEIVIVVIVILIAAIIVLIIFNDRISTVVDFATQRNICISKLSGSCQLFGNPPADWGFDTVTYTENGQSITKSCSEITGVSDCSGVSSN
ncbi:MAG: hypothetical protein ABIJ92_02480 [Candidatus Aenigmatarchaeota archaeon]